MDSEFLKRAGQAIKVQQHQVMSAEEQMYQMKNGISQLQEINDENLDELDRLIAKAESLCSAEGISTNNLSLLEQVEGRELAAIIIDEPIESNVNIIHTDVIDYNSEWTNYMLSVNKYANDHSIDLVKDPYATLLSQSQHEELMSRIKDDYCAHKPEMDKYDYIISATCGVFAGVIDSIFVGNPNPSNSVLGKWTEEMTDKTVIKIAKMHGWQPRDGDGAIANAISALEHRYKVNYDQATGKEVNYLLEMTKSNHHFKSLSHAPDIVGMIFSIIDQFSNTSHFLDNGKLITYHSESSQLIGGNLIAKIFAGFVNWLFHCISDIAGSSPNRRKNPELYGSGISIPFFELFQGIGIGSIGEDKLTIADTAVKMFEQGYDARFGMAMSIPVFINELLVRVCFMIKRHFYHKEPWKKCIPVVLIRELRDSESNAVILRRMLLASYGSMCLVDFGDAAIRSGGMNSIAFLLHLNFIAWKKFSINLAITGVMELRLNHEAHHLNIKKLDKDLQEEWNRLYLEAAN